MKLENVLKKFDDEKLEIKKFTVSADKTEKKDKRSNKNILVDFKDKITKYMLMPFQVLNEVFMPKKMDISINSNNIESNDTEGDEIMQKCNGKKKKRKCIKKAIKKTCRRKGNMRKICKRTLKRKLLH